MNKYAAELRKLHGAVTERKNPFAPSNLLRSSSPGVNWLFGKNHGFPFGFSTLLWGVKKSGKSLLSYDWTAQLHKDDPEALVIKFDTEFRDQGQLSEEDAAMKGIDLDRLITIEANKPEHIFDAIKNQVAAIIDKGGKVKLIIIDSISDIMGRREAGQESVLKHQIGDHAMTMQIGLKSIIETQRQKQIALVMTAHARDEMDPHEVMRGNTKKPAAANAVLHYCEFSLYVAKNLTKTGRTDALGRDFKDESKKDFTDDGEQTGHKVLVWMQDNSMGPKNRSAEFTLDYAKGIVNQHEEIFRLGLSWQIIGRPNKLTYVVGEKQFVGKPAMLEALKKDTSLQQFIIAALLEREKSGTFINATKAEEVEE
jgi:RecA/RadA recombinase